MRSKKATRHQGNEEEEEGCGVVYGYFVEINLLVEASLDSRLRGNDDGWI